MKKPVATYTPLPEGPGYLWAPYTVVQMCCTNCQQLRKQKLIWRNTPQLTLPFCTQEPLPPLASCCVCHYGWKGYSFLDPDDFVRRKGLRTRYAKKLLNNDYYGQIRILTI